MYYLVFALLSLVAGVIFSLVIRVELYSSGNRIISTDNLNYYNLSITVHGLVMLFFVLMPALYGALGNYLIPIYVGSPEIIFPRLNNCSVILTYLSLVILLLALLTEYSIGAGWTLYAPLSLYPVNTTVLIIVGLAVSGVGSLITSINYILTAFHTLILSDLFVPAMVITAVMLVLVLPILTGGLLLIISDLYFNTIFYRGIINGNAGDPVLYQHLFWYFGKPCPSGMVTCLLHNTICWDIALVIPMYYTVSLLYALHKGEICLPELASVVRIIGAPLKRRRATTKQVTNGLNLVGTSETLRVGSPFSPEDHWNEWLAGFLDAGGCLSVTPKGSCRCHATLDITDEHTLLQVKDKLGGTVSLRKGVNSYLWTLSGKEQMTSLVNRVNGNIRNSVKVPQFERVCKALGITFIPASPLSLDNAWFAGYFDANGTIYALFRDSSPFLAIKVVNKEEVDVRYFQTFFGGGLSCDKRTDIYDWRIQGQADIHFMLDYFKSYPPRTSKLKRILLVNQFYHLRYLRAHRACPITDLGKAWQAFREAWGSR